MMNRFTMICLILGFYTQALFGTNLDWISPTDKYLQQFSIEDVKYNLRLDYVTFEQKPLLDKAVAQESLGFFGYYGASGDYRVYQDMIRIVFEEILGFTVRDDFHFLAVPNFPGRTVNDLEDVASIAFGSHAKMHEMTKQLLPFHPSLYANHNKIGYCPAKNFTLSSKHPNEEDLYWLFNLLQMDTDIIPQAYAIGRETFGLDHRVLIQLFDRSHENGQEPYAGVDAYCYPAHSKGYPFQNQALSDYLLNSGSAYPPQFYLVLNNKTILNPDGPLVIKRYAKIQPSKLKAYEQQLRNLIRNASYDSVQRDLYVSQLY